MRLGFPAPTPMSLVVMAVCILVFVLQNTAAGTGIDDYLSFSFANHLAWREPWRWITYQYLHGGVSHIFWNLIGIYFFLPPLEKLWGWRRSFAFYTLGGIAAGVTFGIISVFDHQIGFLIGASGAIMACIGAVALLFPDMSIWLVIITIPIRAVAIIIALWFALTVVADHNLSNAAHLGGLAFGFLAPYYGAPLWHNFQRRVHRAQVKRQMDQEKNDELLVDRILQKVHDTGMNSLSRWERRALKRATERQRLAEVARGKRGY